MAIIDSLLCKAFEKRICGKPEAAGPTMAAICRDELLHVAEFAYASRELNAERR
jgi:hypothetical protein